MHHSIAMAAVWFVSFCKSTTIHGFKYLVEKGSSVVQKVFWAIAIIVSISCTLRLLVSLMDKVNKNPIIIYRDDVPIDVTRIPFPAFTICSLKKSKGDMTTLEVTWLNKYTAKGNEVASEFEHCRTVNMAPLENLFKPVVDVQRFMTKLWGYYANPRTGYTNTKLDNKSQPYSTINSELGFDGVIFSGHWFLPNTIPIFEPFRITFHSPYEMPSSRDHQFSIMQGSYASFLIIPRIKKIDETMLGMKPSERSCYFPHEKNLTLFHVYTENNCIDECVSNLIAEECGCILDRTIANASFPICNTNSESIASCIEATQLKLSDESCGCYPLCEELKYEIEKTNADFSDLNPEARTTGTSAAMFRIRFKSSNHYPLIRRKHVTETDIFAFVGGLLGLFLGISVISFAEVAMTFLRPVIEKVVEKFKKFKSKAYGRVKKIGIASYFKFYLRESSIHSFSYIGSDIYWIEKLFWLSTFLLSMTGCVFMIKNLYVKLNLSAITLAVDDRSVQVSEIPFPAITFFGRYPNPLRLGRYPDIFDNPEPIAGIHFPMWLLNNNRQFLMGMVADALVTKLEPYAIGFAMNNGNFTGQDNEVVATIKTVSRVDWMRNQTGSFCGAFDVPFSEILTSRGFGFSFNIMKAQDLLNMEEISDDFFYEENVMIGNNSRTFESPPPWKFKITDFLELKIWSSENSEENLYDYYGNGFSVHAPDELPFMLNFETVFSFSGAKLIEILVTPVVVKSDESLKDFDYHDRSCYFENERKLQFFKLYTKRNCEIECFSNFTQKICGCTPFDVPRNSSVRVCSVFDVQCLTDLRERFVNPREDDLIASCECLTTCDLVSYDVEIRDLEINFEQYFSSNKTATYFTLRFKEIDFNPLWRARQFTMIDFLSYVGGVLGLFAGISVLTFFELFYFFSLRIVSNVLKSRKTQHHKIILVKPAK